MKQRAVQTSFGWHYQDGRMVPSTAETRLFLEEAASRALRAEVVEDWQIEEEIEIAPDFAPLEEAWFEAAISAEEFYVDPPRAPLSARAVAFVRSLLPEVEPA